MGFLLFEDTMELSAPVEIKVIHERENGSGVIEIPLLPATVLDLSRTAGGSEGKAEITVADLEQIVANFALFPGPVPIGVHPHRNFSERGGFSPGFVNAVTVRGAVLYGEVDLVAGLFAEVQGGGWRGFSVEIAQDLKTATKAMDGWALVGGVFTNRPATDVNFQIAASADFGLPGFAVDKTGGVATKAASYTSSLRARENTMENEEKITSLEADLSTQKELVTSLRTQKDEMAGESAAIETKLTEANRDLGAANIALSEQKAKLAALEDEAGHLRKQLATEQQARRETDIKLEAEQNRALKDQVIDLVHKAIDRGVSAKHFEGVDENAVAWFNNRFVTVEAFSQFVDALPTVTDSATSSGRKPDGQANLSSESRKRLLRMGLDPKYAGVTNEDQILEMAAKKREQGDK